MNVIQLYHRLGRHARGRDFTKLSLSEQDDLAQAANAALQRVYNDLPIYFKEQTQGFTLLGPQSITVGVTPLSQVVTGFTCPPGQIGCSVQINGDPGWNQFLGPQLLCNPYQGPVAASLPGQLYGDAIFSTTYPFDRIIGNPRFADQSMAPLISSTLSRGNQDPGIWLAQTVGRPQIWWTQALGNSQGNAPVVVLRVSPAPDSNYAINVRMGFWPKRLTLADYTAATTITVPDQFLDASLVPIAMRELMLTPVWETFSPENDKLVLDMADRAELFVKNQPGQVGAPDNRIFTPMGY
jgi:hypothetical protein